MNKKMTSKRPSDKKKTFNKIMQVVLVCDLEKLENK